MKKKKPEAPEAVQSQAQPKFDMPLRFPEDHPHVLHLLNESERLNAMAARWQNAKHPNLIAQEFCLMSGWAFAMVAAHLRCYLAGELVVKPPELKRPARTKID